jgi:hypothetical protein
MMRKLPLLKMGEGGGCMMFCAIAKTTRKTTKKARFASDVSHFWLIIHKPTCNSTPTTAKVSARRKRGSERNNPFQLVCIASRESGRYVTQKTIPVRPRAAVQAWKTSRRVIIPTSPAMAERTKANSAVNTHAPCRYTIRTLVPRSFSSGPRSMVTPISSKVEKNRIRGDLAFDMGRFYLVFMKSTQVFDILFT